MDIDLNDFFQIYLTGCVFVVILTLSKAAIAYFLNWLTKENNLIHNISKLIKPDETTLVSKVGKFTVIVLLEALLSWINVVLIIFQIVIIVLKHIRVALQAKPEIVKKLVYPLKHNTLLSREAVWAYNMALRVTEGLQPSEHDLFNSLDTVGSYYPSFRKQAALNHFKSLEIINDGVILSTNEMLSDIG